MEHSFSLPSKAKTLTYAEVPTGMNFGHFTQWARDVNVHIQVGMLAMSSRTEYVHIFLLSNLEYKRTTSMQVYKT